MLVVQSFQRHWRVRQMGWVSLALLGLVVLWVVIVTEQPGGWGLADIRLRRSGVTYRQAAEQIGTERIAIVGGVAANSELRAALPEAVAAPLPLCTDNAAMIASAARLTPAAVEPLALDAYATAA